MISTVKSKYSAGKTRNLNTFFINLTNWIKSALQTTLLLVFCAHCPWVNSAEESIELDNKSLAINPPVSSKVARKELQKLMGEGMDLLVSELVDKGTFFPFVAMLGHDGAVRLIATPAALRDKHANAENALNALVKKTQGLAAQKRIRAAAFFMDYVATRSDTGVSQSGVRVELNHIHPDALSLFIPYTLTEDGKLRVMTPQFKPGKNLLFDQSP